MDLNELKKKVKEENLRGFYSRKLKQKKPYFDRLGLKKEYYREPVSPGKEIEVKDAYSNMCNLVDLANSEEEIMLLIGNLKHPEFDE